MATGNPKKIPRLFSWGISLFQTAKYVKPAIVFAIIKQPLRYCGLGGGIVIAIKDMLDIPVRFVGLGERPQDIAEFNPDEFVGALFA